MARPSHKFVPAKPLGVDMGRVLAVTTVIDHVCHGTLSAEAAQSALESAGRLPPASTPRFTLFASHWRGFAWRHFRYARCDEPAADRGQRRHQCACPPLACPASAIIPLIQPLCAAFIAGVVRWLLQPFPAIGCNNVSVSVPCMVLVPGPHIPQTVVSTSLARASRWIARLAYAGVIVLLICAGGSSGSRRSAQTSR